MSKNRTNIYCFTKNIRIYFKLFITKFGVTDEDRTRDSGLTIQKCYRYTTVTINLVDTPGLEPGANRLKARCSTY